MHFARPIRHSGHNPKNPLYTTGFMSYFGSLYFSLGSPDSAAVRIGAILPGLRQIALAAPDRISKDR